MSRATSNHLCWAATTIALLAAATVCADEAVFRDGRRQAGTLVVRDSRLHWQHGGSTTPLPAGLHEVRFPGPRPTPFRSGTAFRLELFGGDRLTGSLIDLDAEQVRFRTAWGQELQVPRAAVAAVRQPGDLLTMVDDDFEHGLRGWTAVGSPAVTDRHHTSGRSGLLLAAAGQAVQTEVKPPLDGGTVGLNFHEVAPFAGAEAVVEAEFGPGGPGHDVRVRLAGGRGACYAVDGVRGIGTRANVPRTPGWHRLQIEFGFHTLIVTVDGAVLWHSRRQGPGGPLRRVRLALVGEQPGARGELAVDEFSLARAVPERIRTPTQQETDEVWLRSGDQVFGVVVRADRRAVVFQTPHGRQTLPWGEVRGLFFPGRAPAVDRGQGQRVRVWVATGAATDADRLEGVVQELDGQGLGLRHALLGELTLDRGRLERLRWAEER